MNCGLSGLASAAESDLLRVGVLFWAVVTVLLLSPRVEAPGAGAAADFLARGGTRWRPSTTPNMTCERTVRINSGSLNSSGRVAVTNLKLFPASSLVGERDEVRLLVRRRDDAAAEAGGAEGAVRMAKGSSEGLVMGVWGSV